MFTILGVSNVSFGLAPEARAVLNSVFLHHCVQAGLDMAIVNPAHVRPYVEIPTKSARWRTIWCSIGGPTRCSTSSSTSTTRDAERGDGRGETDDPTAAR